MSEEKPGFREVLRRLDSERWRRFADTLPWPYNGMVTDIIGAIEQQCNYLAALGLAAYIETCGRQIFYDGDATVKGRDCFNAFLEYMQLGELRGLELTSSDGKTVYFNEAVRNGLVHEYFMKPYRSGVYMIADDAEANRLGFHVDGDHIVMVVVPLFHRFCEALKRAQTEGKLTNCPQNASTETIG